MDEDYAFTMSVEESSAEYARTREILRQEYLTEAGCEASLLIRDALRQMAKGRSCPYTPALLTALATIAMSGGRE
ncbi:MAG: hypothetical protein LBR38_10190 [Synergistaceae bacterium]|jgi:hypothetical protein|nr:hypothetical protein [Synergistaceae bacterium]